MYNKLGVAFSLLLLKNDPIMQKNGVSLYMLVISTYSLLEWNAIIWFGQNQNKPKPINLCGCTARHIYS